MTLSLLDLSVEELEDEGSTEFNNQEICTICKKNVPPRGSHCAVCQKCFPFRDHHSRWLGTCISKENYANYVYLILLEILLSSLIIFDCIFTMYHSNSFTDFFTNKIPLFPTLLLSLLAFYLSVKNLKSIYLTISQNLNQYERKHRSKIPYLTGLPANALPFNHGFMNNLNEILSTNRKNETKTKAASPGESTL